jgi:hypothetical protein
MDASRTTLGKGGALGPDTLQRMTDDAKQLKAMASSGVVAVDPDAAQRIAEAYDRMVDEIYWIKVGMLTAGQHPLLGTSPYATRVAKYQHEAAEAFLDAVTQLESACTVCAEAFRESARHYVERDQEAVDELNRSGRAV